MCDTPFVAWEWNPIDNKMYYTRSKLNVILSWSDPFEELTRSMPLSNPALMLKFGSV